MTTNRSSKVKQRLAAAGVAVGATLGSFAAVSALSSTDDTTDTTETSDTTTTTTADDPSSDGESSTDSSTQDDLADRGDRPMDAEEPLTGDLADRVTAAAEAAVPGGTVERVETDAQGAAYEAHMVDADGNAVTVTFDENLDVVETISGGPGGPGGHGGDRGDRPMDAEEPLTGDLADRVTAAAEAAVPGGTVERVETDAHGAAYEAHMVDADGNAVTVTFDENLDVVETISGGPGGHGGRDHQDHAGGDTIESTESTDTTVDS